MKRFKNALVYARNSQIVRTDLYFGKTTVGFDCGGPAEDIIIPENAVVVPAFIDEHIHGVSGADTMDGGDAIKKMAEVLPSEGTAYFLGTTMTAPQEKLTSALRAAAKYGNGNSGARFLGIHLEGPFISEKLCGAQPPEYISAPDCKYFEELYAASGNNIRLMTIAPERSGADKLIKCARGHGVTVSIGHTDAAYADIISAIGYGASCVTHTFNAQRGIHHREIGTVGAAMLSDELFTEVIADAVHVSLAALKLLIKNKPKDKVVLITDAIRAKRLPDGESELGGQKVFVKDGTARLADGTLAGSVLKMNEAVKNVVEKCGVGFKDAVNFASANPAKNLGLDALGCIDEGKAASYTVLSPDFEVLTTIRDGEIIFVKE